MKKKNPRGENKLKNKDVNNQEANDIEPKKWIESLRCPLAELQLSHIVQCQCVFPLWAAGDSNERCDLDFLFLAKARMFKALSY